MGEQMTIKEKHEKEARPLSIAQEARKEAIRKLQKDLAEKGPTTPPKVQVARIKALITLLSNEVKEEYGDINIPELMHYSEPTESAANESNIGEAERAA